MPTGQPDNGFDALAASPVFAGVAPEAVRTIAGALAPECWAGRRVVMRPDQTVERFYMLRKGRVKITRQNMRNGREITLFLLGPGDGFNVVTLLDGRLHDVSAETLEPVEVLWGRISQWKGWLEAYPALRLAVRRYIFQRLNHLSQLACDLALHDTMTRLAHLLLNYCSDRLTCADLRLIGDLSHEELAHMIGTVRVVVNRLLAELKREGIVDTDGGRLRVLDLHKLLEKAEEQVSSSPQSSPGPSSWPRGPGGRL